MEAKTSEEKYEPFEPDDVSCFQIGRIHVYVKSLQRA